MIESLSVKAELSIIRKQVLKLSPFLNTVFLYFVIVEDPHGELSTTFLKCAPIVCLMIYIVLKGVKFTAEYKGSQRVLLGLVFSCVGDALLNIDLFPHGMGAFALAQICYISAFGWKPLKLAIGAPLYLIAATVVAFLYKGLDEVLAVGLPVYVALLITMCWRSLARAAHKRSILNIFCATGSVLFVISDGLIAVNMFFIDIPNARIWIMSTYYVAQLAIALSTALEFDQPKVTPKRSKPSIQSRITVTEDPRRRINTKD